MKILRHGADKHIKSQSPATVGAAPVAAAPVAADPVAAVPVADEPAAQYARVTAGQLFLAILFGTGAGVLAGFVVFNVLGVNW
jgi:hypothetical protein